MAWIEHFGFSRLPFLERLFWGRTRPPRLGDLDTSSFSIPDVDPCLLTFLGQEWECTWRTSGTAHSFTTPGLYSFQVMLAKQYSITPVEEEFLYWKIVHAPRGRENVVSLPEHPPHQIDLECFSRLTVVLKSSQFSRLDPTIRGQLFGLAGLVSHSSFAEFDGMTGFSWLAQQRD